jgi:poly-gamma-glutamate synthesis protein (capsule biosynthesis protein)
MRSILTRFITVLFIFTLLAGCTGAPTASVVTPTPVPATATSTPTEMPISVWAAPELPTAVLTAEKSLQGFQQAGSAASATFSLDIQKGDASDQNSGSIQWIYALEAPFPTVTDGVDLDLVKALWAGTIPDTGSPKKLLVSSETKAIFDVLWGESSSSTVVEADEDQFSNNNLKDADTWALVPFEGITPRWKVLQIGGLSPLDKPLDTKAYGLKVNFAVTSTSSLPEVAEKEKSLLSQLPATNRDESKMTVVMMTGTTALVRAIAYKMEIKGLDYPIEKVKDWFANADVIHVSNEVSFNEDCPFPDYSQHGLQFCSSPKYIQTLQDLGVNVVELTGNHENDYGAQYLDYSIDMYDKAGMKYYGGGKTPEDGQAPLKLEVNGNKIAFIGCNPNGPATDWATDKQAGSAPCDMEKYQQTITDLKSQGYVVIATFQHDEIYKYLYGDFIANDFRNAAKAGADIVSGSQSHYAMGFQFIGNSIIHYGLGNFLFDQMTYEGVGDNIRREFIDKHVIYNGKYISTQLNTAWLVDWAQPNPMDEKQRASFLSDVFNGSIWSDKNASN